MKQLIKNITIQIYKVLTYLIPVNKKMIIFRAAMDVTIQEIQDISMKRW